MADLAGLIERVRAATGPDRELDLAIAFTVRMPFSGWRSFNDHAAKHDYETAFIAHRVWMDDGRIRSQPPARRQALALVERMRPRFTLDRLRKWTESLRKLS